MTEQEYPVIEKGEINLNGKTYRYEICQPTFKLFDIKLFEVWNEKGESFSMVIFPEHTVEERIREAVKIDRWEKQ